jgi:hypothetical protein
MHRVVKAHLADFQQKFEVSDQESKQFEAFVNYNTSACGPFLQTR